MVLDLREKYEEMPSSPKFSRLYKDDTDWGHMFAVLHKDLNEHFSDINGRVKTTHHYWADHSRDLLTLIDTVEADLHKLKRAGVETTFDRRYQDALERCRPWLAPSGGSRIPDDFDPIELVEYERVFARATMSVQLEKQGREPAKLKMVGSGSYAHVYSYTDPDYDIQFAVKRAKKGLQERDLARFKHEFETMKRLSFPYVVEVYRYNDELNEYRMEFCDTTLRDYISKKNANLPFGIRKRIALQFLYGINYLHRNRLLHRDISLQNTLLKVYDGGAVLVKLSDFGLVKDVGGHFTHSKTEMKGTHRDPMLADFKDYEVVNEMYSIAWVLAYIFTGKERLPASDDPISQIILKCASLDVSLRYPNVLALIEAVEQVVAPPAKTTA